MSFIDSPNYCIYFGNAIDNLQNNNIYSDMSFLSVKNKIEIHNQQKLHAIFFLKQTHSVTIYCLSETHSLKKPLDIFQYEGDAIVTNQKNIGIGVVTADCLPIIFYDQKNHIISNIHAGWRGLSRGIISAVIKKMFDVFGSHPEDLKIHLGPSASVCCYEVQPDFFSHFKTTVFENKIIENRHKKFFFNPLRSALLELHDNHVSEEFIDTTHHVCTICTPGFCSVRNDQKNAGRQPSIAFLK